MLDASKHFRAELTVGSCSEKGTLSSQEHPRDVDITQRRISAQLQQHGLVHPDLSALLVPCPSTCPQPHGIILTVGDIPSSSSAAVT